MTSDRKIITKEQLENVSDLFIDIDELWKELPDAPKHTDEEYDKTRAELRMMAGTLGRVNVALSDAIVKNGKLEARIKELEYYEGFVKNHKAETMKEAKR